jgi:hypothetical protein
MRTPATRAGHVHGPTARVAPGQDLPPDPAEGRPLVGLHEDRNRRAGAVQQTVCKPRRSAKLQENSRYHSPRCCHRPPVRRSVGHPEADSVAVTRAAPAPVMPPPGWKTPPGSGAIAPGSLRSLPAAPGEPPDGAAPPRPWAASMAAVGPDHQLDGGVRILLVYGLYQ